MTTAVSTDVAVEACTCGKCKLAADDPRHGRGTAYAHHKCRCLPCSAAESERLRVYYQAKREERLAYAAEYRQKHAAEIAAYLSDYWAENKVALKAYASAYREQNSERLLAYARDYWSANKTEIKKRLAEYWKANPGKKRPWDWIAPAARIAIYERDDFTCHLCGLEVDLSASWPEYAMASLDHLVPRSHGGGDDPSNLKTAHLGCNIRRGNRSVAAFQKKMRKELAAADAARN